MQKAGGMDPLPHDRGVMFKKYEIVIFKGRSGSLGHMRVAGWLGGLVLLVLIGLAGTVAYLWSFYLRSLTLEHQLREAEKTVQAQNVQLVTIASKLHTLQEDVRRVQQFDAKLRVMMNVDREPAETSGAGSEAVQQDVARGYVPLYRQDLLAKRMHTLAEDLVIDVGMEELRQQELILSLRENREFLVATPSIWPSEGHLSSTFGYRTSPFTGQAAMHAGLDVANKVGTPIVAPAKGRVTFTGWDGAYGICVTINHGNAVTTRYAHMQRSVVKEGQMVNRGELIGYVGNTGRSTGPHLHYEVRVGGVPVNPMRYILN